MFTHVSFVSLPVEDIHRARDFYRDRLGMAVTVDEPFGESRWIMLEMREARTRIHLDHRPERIDRTGQPALPLITADVDEAAAKLRDASVEIIREPKPAEWNPSVRYALFRDSEGNIILMADG